MMQNKRYYTNATIMRNNRYDKRAIREWVTFSLDPSVLLPAPYAGKEKLTKNFMLCDGSFSCALRGETLVFEGRRGMLL